MENDLAVKSIQAHRIVYGWIPACAGMTVDTLIIVDVFIFSVFSVVIVLLQFIMRPVAERLVVAMLAAT